MSERGSMTIFAVLALTVLMFTAAAVAMVNGLVAGHRRAQSAADLVALSAAVSARRSEDPCVVAQVIAAASGARLESCHADGRTVTVIVTVEGPGVMGQASRLAAEARAGD